jgi:hypothetical protein
MRKVSAVIVAGILGIFLAGCASTGTAPAAAAAPPAPAEQSILVMPISQLSFTNGFALKIFKVESGLYPFVQCYMRTFNQEMQPLINLNPANVGVMVQGKAYDPLKRQYAVQTMYNREEPIRVVMVLDCSTSMALGFEYAKTAITRFCDSKRPQDQVAVLALRGPNGCELVSNFERDAAAISRRLADVPCDGGQSRLYDAIGAAMQMCAMSSQGGVNSGAAEYIISNSIVVLSDGNDEGSALSRGELMGRITSLQVPVPIYTLAYSGSAEQYKNLQALSSNTFGVYYSIGQVFANLQRSVENILNILQNDYVVTIRSHVPADGNRHSIHIGVEYPSQSGKMTYQRTEFDAVEAPLQIAPVREAWEKIDKLMPPPPDGNPFLPQL